MSEKTVDTFKNILAENSNVDEAKVNEALDVDDDGMSFGFDMNSEIAGDMFAALGKLAKKLAKEENSNS